MQIRALFALLLVCLPSVVVAQEPTAPPPETDRQIHLGGYIQYDFLMRLDDDRDAATFRFRRVRLQGSGILTDKIGWAASIEVTSTPVLRDAFVTLKHIPGATLRVGQLVMPYGMEQYVFSSNTLEFTERATTDVIASRDAGIVVSNDRPFFGWFSYAAAVTNGTRQNVADNNNDKDGIVRLTATPGRLPGFSLGVNGMRGAQPDGMRTRVGADVSYERRLFRIAAELDTEQTGEGSEKRAAYAFGAWRLHPRTVRPWFHHAEVGARYTRTRNLLAPLNQWDLSGIYYVHPNMRIMCDLILRRDVVAEPSPAIFHARANIRF